MHGDFSRDSFDPKLNFARVLMQQGRLIVDADWNEQSAILLHYMRTLAADLIGWHGGVGVAPGIGQPYNTVNAENTGPNLVTLDPNNKEITKISGGRYYLDGLMIITNDNPISVDRKPEIAFDNEKSDALENRLLYLDVSEKHVVAELDSSIRDVALGGLDTTTRVKTVSRLRLLHTDTTADKIPKDQDSFRNIEFQKTGDTTKHKINPRKLNETNLPSLTAFTNHISSNDDDCSIDPSTGYTGLENQLYRVEVHHGGTDGETFWYGSELDPKTKDPRGAFTLKWSRDNGSIVYAGMTTGDGVTLTTKWRDDSRAIQKGDYVELISGDKESGTLAEVTSITEDDGQYMLKFDSQVPITKGETILVRRWDHRSRTEFPVANNGGFVVKESGEKTKSVSILIEDGISVQLEIPSGAQLQPGDHWLIPARASTGDIIWPKKPGKVVPDSVLATFTQHHYAPIALIDKDGKVTDLRRNISNS